MAKKKNSIHASPEQLKRIQKAFEHQFAPTIELHKGDWVFVNNETLGQVTDRYQTLWEVSYKIHVLDTIAVDKPIFLLITNRDSIAKVPVNSKLSSLLVLYGKK
jgi:hypothetical protein